MKEQIPAIVLGCHKIGLGIIRALGEAGVPVIAVSYSSMDMGYASRYVIRRYRFPHPDREPGHFLSLLEKLGDRWSGSVLIPSDDATLIPVSKQRNTLGERFKVAAEDWAVVETCIVKKNTYALAQRIGVPCPGTYMPASPAEAGEIAERIGFPCLLKPTVGHSFYERYKRKMLFIENKKRLTSAFSYTARQGIEVMLQEYIPGDDASGTNYNAFFVDGRPLIEVTAQKARLSPPRIGFPRVVESRWIPELPPVGRKIMAELGFTGFCCMEFKKDARDGVHRLMEINARLNLSTPLSVKAGVNFPYLLYRFALTGEEPKAVAGFRQGIYWIDLGKDLTESLMSYPREHYSLGQYIRPYANPHVFDILSAHDMGPSLKHVRDIVLKGPRKLLENSRKRSET